MLIKIVTEKVMTESRKYFEYSCENLQIIKTQNKDKYFF